MRPTPPALNDRSALLVVDIQRGGAAPAEESGIEVMDGYVAMAATAECIVSAARAAAMPVIFIQELHRPSGVDFGRELDGEEGIHCVEGAPGTELWPTLRPGTGDYYVPKRRYSAFFGTDLDIVLKGLGVDTVVLIGSLTDVCVHYSFVDAHQRDFRARVIEDCVIGSTVERHLAALDAMEYLQFGARRRTEEVLTVLGARALTPIGIGDIN
jgi:biuret amidohydrolase